MLCTEWSCCDVISFTGSWSYTKVLDQLSSGNQLSEGSVNVFSYPSRYWDILTVFTLYGMGKIPLLMTMIFVQVSRMSQVIFSWSSKAPPHPNLLNLPLLEQHRADPGQIKNLRQCLFVKELLAKGANDSLSPVMKCIKHTFLYISAARQVYL